MATKHAFKLVVEELNAFYGMANWGVVGSFVPKILDLEDAEPESDGSAGSEHGAAGPKSQESKGTGTIEHRAKDTKSEAKRSWIERTSRLLAKDPDYIASCILKNNIPDRGKPAAPFSEENHPKLIKRVAKRVRGGTWIAHALNERFPDGGGSDGGQPTAADPRRAKKSQGAGLFADDTTYGEFMDALRADQLYTDGGYEAFYDSINGLQVDDKEKGTEGKPKLTDEQRLANERAVVASYVLAALIGPRDFTEDLEKEGIPVVAGGGQGTTPPVDETDVSEIDAGAPGRPIGMEILNWMQLEEVERRESDPLYYCPFAEEGAAKVFKGQDLVAVGRGGLSECPMDFRIPSWNNFASRYHCVLYRDPKNDCWFLVDLSTNGTLVTRREDQEVPWSIVPVEDSEMGSKQLELKEEDVSPPPEISSCRACIRKGNGDPVAFYFLYRAELRLKSGDLICLSPSVIGDSGSALEGRDPNGSECRLSHFGYWCGHPAVDPEADPIEWRENLRFTYISDSGSVHPV